MRVVVGHIGGHIAGEGLVPMCAFGHNLVPLVYCLHRVDEGDLELLHEAEVAGSHFPAVGRGLADNRPALIEWYVLVVSSRYIVIDDFCGIIFPQVFTRLCPHCTSTSRAGRLIKRLNN